MTVLYVTSLANGEGKTALSSGLYRLLDKSGQAPALFKPVIVDNDHSHNKPDPDTALFANLQDSTSSSYLPITIEIKEDMESLSAESRKDILKEFNILADKTKNIIIEGPAIGKSPESSLVITQDLVDAFDAHVILVVQFSMALKSSDILDVANILGDRLAGIVINRVPRYRKYQVQTSIVAPLTEQGMPVIGVLPEERCMLGVTIRQLAEYIGAEFLLGEEMSDGLVDHLMIGGWILNSGVEYFSQSEKKAVIVRGDRPDIQMAALHTTTRCLILTGGQRPIQYVEYEAREQSVPVLMVSSDTVTTAKSLENLFSEVGIGHPEKSECFGNLLADTTDLGLITSLLEGA